MESFRRMVYKCAYQGLNLAGFVSGVYLYLLSETFAQHTASLVIISAIIIAFFFRQKMY